VGATDGSLIPNTTNGTYAYVITRDDEFGEIDEENDIIIGSATCPVATTMTSQTTEHYGLLSLLTIVMIICATNQLDERSIRRKILTIWVDNREVVRRCSYTQKQLNSISQYVCTDYELWMMIRRMIDTIPIKINIQWVKAHQDQHHHPRDLLQNAQLNIMVDKQAEIHRRLHEVPEPQQYWTPGKIQWNTTQGTIIDNIREYVINQTVGKQMEQYLLDRNPHWSSPIMETINWKAHTMALKRKKPIQRMKAVQLIHDWQNVGIQKGLFESSRKGGSSLSSKEYKKLITCPMNCGEKENRMHYLRCNNINIQSKRKSEIEKLATNLRAIDTYEGIISSTVTILHKYAQGIAIENIVSSNPLTEEEEQLGIAI
jgi:hypothetical protein